MFSNTPRVPFISLVTAVALLFVVWLERRSRAGMGSLPMSLSSVEIGLTALSAVLLVYGCIGLLSVWIEGEAPVPGQRRRTPGLVSLVVGLGLGVAVAVLGALLVGVILSELHGAPVRPLLEGGIMAGISLSTALGIVVYRRYFVTEDVLVEDQDSEVPW